VLKKNIKDVKPIKTKQAKL